MSQPYRFYFRDQYNRIVCRLDRPTSNDADAMQLAEIVSSISSDLCDSFEIWQGARCVAPVSKAGRDDFIAEVSLEIRDLLETVLRSDWPLAQSRKLLTHLDTLRRPLMRDGDALCRILNAAVSATGADFGNIQMLVTGELHIAAQACFDRDFLDFFAVVKDQTTACGAAIGRGGRVIIPDVRTSTVYDTASRGAMLKAACLSCQSTPLTARGTVVGILSTHRRIVWRPAPVELNLIDGFAAQASAALSAA